MSDQAAMEGQDFDHTSEGVFLILKQCALQERRHDKL